MNRALAIIVVLAVATILFASATALLLAKPAPTWIYHGAYQDSLLFQSENGYLAYDVNTHKVVMSPSYRGIIDVVKEASK